LYGLGGDDGVYFSAAVRLVHGVIPYRDYVLVHPPLIAVLLAPFAMFGELVGTADAFAVARLATVIVGAVDVVLIGLLLRRFGTRAVVVGCAVLALHGAAVNSAETIYLEPYLVLLVLAGLLVLFDETDLASPRRQFAGSVLLGLACATKIWAIVPAGILVAIALLFPASGGSRRGQTGRVVGGITAGFLLPVLPFAAAAPTGFLHDVFVSQLQRHGARQSASVRVASLIGLGRNQHQPSSLILVGGVTLAVVVLASYVWLARSGRAKLDPFTVFAAVSAVLVAVMFFVPDQYFWHYGGFFAPFLALVLARPVAELAATAWPPVRAGLTFAAVGLTLVFAIGTSAALAPVDSASVPTTLIDAHIPSGSCVVTDNSSLVVIMGRSISGSRCPQVIDPYGIDLVYAHGGHPTSSAVDRLHAYWANALDRAQYLLLTSHGSTRLPWRWLQPQVERDFHRVDLHRASRRFLLWQRDTDTREPSIAAGRRR
jgi:MFS family permease